jgi:hypothetical protein
VLPNRADFTGSQDVEQARWQHAEVASPHLDRPVPVVAAKDIPYIPHANRLQNLNIYLPRTPQSAALIGCDRTRCHPQERARSFAGHAASRQWVAVNSPVQSPLPPTAARVPTNSTTRDQ